jgi:hypothetical protein
MLQKGLSGPGETLPPFLPTHSIPAYKFAWSVRMNHADDLPGGYQLHLQCHSTLWKASLLSTLALEQKLRGCLLALAALEPGISVGRPLGFALTTAPGDVAGPAPQDTAGAFQV